MTKTMKTDTLPLDCADGLDMYIGFEEYGGIATGILQTKECNIHILNLGNDTVDYKTWQSLLRKRGMTTAVNVGDPVADLLDSI